MIDIKNRWCRQPWAFTEIHGNGFVYNCCPGWVKKPLGNILEDLKYKNFYKLEKKHIKSLPFNIRKTLPVIKSLEGCLYIPHLNISEPKFIKTGIEIHALAFYDKKYDNIIN